MVDQPFYTCFCHNFPVNLIIKSLFEISTYIIRCAFSKRISGKSRHSCVEIRTICHQNLCRGRFYQITEFCTGIFFCQVKGIAFDRMTGIAFSVIQSVNLCTSQSHHIHDSIGSSSKETKIGVIHDTRPVGENKFSAIFHVMANLLFKTSTEHIQHGSCHYLIAIQILFHINHIHI